MAATWSAVSSIAGRPGARARADRGAQPLVLECGQLEGGPRDLLVALSPALDHAHLQRQQLIVREPTDSRVALLEVVGEVGSGDGLADGRVRCPQLGRQVVRVEQPAVLVKPCRGSQPAATWP